MNSTAYTLGGSPLLLAGPINNDSSNDQAINLPITLAAGSGTVNTVTNNVTLGAAPSAVAVRSGSP